MENARIQKTPWSGVRVVHEKISQNSKCWIQKRDIKAHEEAGIRDRVKVMIGGAPVTQSFADKIGADAYAPDAAAASDAAKQFVK